MIVRSVQSSAGFSLDLGLLRVPRRSRRVPRESGRVCAERRVTKTADEAPRSATAAPIPKVSSKPVADGTPVPLIV